ncbi:hypothetical protein ACFY36_32160 [Actinoplanes sp. NPDC000266]
MVNVLRLEPLLFPAEFSSHRVRIFVDGVDVVAAAYGPGGCHGKPVAGFAPSWLLGSHGLAASPTVREVELAGSDTTEDRLTVDIRQAGAMVTWDHWRLIDMGTVVGEGPDIRLSPFRFDAVAYASELARAAAHADRKWPARAVAELLEAETRHDDYDSRWIRRCFTVRAPEDRPDVVEVGYYARDPSGRRYAMPGHYIVAFPIDDTDPGDQAQAIAHRLGHEDLKPISTHQPPRRRR